MTRPAHLSALALLMSLALAPAGVKADNPTPYPGTRVMKTPHSFAALVQRLEEAVKDNKMGIVARASATAGAKKIGVTIPGNMVVMVYHPKYAVRMLDASVPAGIEAPIRYYITENADGTATLTYRIPSSVFNPYENAELDQMAKELDGIFERIARDAAGQ
ncbi:MAG TPA: DUF302 domain-containing protein [Gammaproteobacteria bacterium]|nr:DUF302 domain-containing protein [Gammaproteobacteria bacterium]